MKDPDRHADGPSELLGRALRDRTGEKLGEKEQNKPDSQQSQPELRPAGVGGKKQIPARFPHNESDQGEKGALARQDAQQGFVLIRARTKAWRID